MKRTTLVVGLALLASLAIGLFVQAQSGLAELHVQKIVLEPPSAVVRGEGVQVYARVQNTGSRNAAQFAVGLFFRQAREGEPWTLLGSRMEENLGPSQQDFLEVTFDFETADLELGTYELKIVADVSNQIPEVDELNNELKTTMTLVASTLGLPELQPVSLTFDQIGSSESDPWTITLLVENLGEYLLSSFDVRFLVDGAEVTLPVSPATAFIPDTGATTTVVGTLDPHGLGFGPGTYLVTALVDASEQIAEQDEGNNTISASLTIQTLELHPLSLRFDRSVVRLDEEITLTAEIGNDGNGLAKDVKVDFYIDHIRFATTRIDQLGAAPQEAQAILDADHLGLVDAPKVYEITVVVDPDNVLSESDEANNELVRTLTILPPSPKKAELHPESLELTPASPAELGRSDSVTVTSVIKNTGRDAAQGFDIGFFYRVKGGLRWQEILCSDGVSCGEVTLLAGEQARIVGAFPVRSLGLAPGVYEVRIVADTGDGVDELDETNNELVTTLTLLASRRPDLTVAINAIDPGGALQNGQTARVTVTVTNVGERVSEATSLRLSYCELLETGTTTQQVSCSNPGAFGTLGVLPDSSLPVPALGIGESETFLFNVETAFMQPGQYQIRADVDPLGLVDEQDEILGAAMLPNNVAALNLLVLGADLVPVAGTFRMEPDGLINQDQIGEIDFSVTVANQGVVAAGQFYVTFGLYSVVDGSLVPVVLRTCYDSGQECSDLPYFGQVEISGLGAGAQLVAGCTLDLAGENLGPGQYIVQAYVDRSSIQSDLLSSVVDKGNVAEHSEINNSAELALTLIGEACEGCGPADPAGAEFELRYPQIRAKPEDVRVYAQVFNLGTGGPETIRVEFTLTLPNGGVLIAKSDPILNIDPLLPNGGSVFVGTRFFEGVDYYGPLAIGDQVEVTAVILTPDGTPENNVGVRVTIVRE